MRLIKNKIRLKELYNVDISEKDFIQLFSSNGKNNFKEELISYLSKHKIKKMDELHQKYVSNQLDIHDTDFDTTFYSNLESYLLGKSYFNFTGDDKTYYFFYIKNKNFFVSIKQIKVNRIHANEILFTYVNELSYDNPNYDRIPDFFSNTENISKLFNSIFIIINNNSEYTEDTVFCFKSALEDKEIMRENAVFEIDDLFNKLFYYLAQKNIEVISEKYQDIINKYSNYIPNSLYSEYINDAKETVLNGFNDIKNSIKSVIYENKQYDKNFIIDNVIEAIFEGFLNKKILFIPFQTDGDRNKIIKFLDILNLFMQENQSLKNLFSEFSFSPDIYIKKVRKNHVRNRLYRTVLRQFGILNLKYEESFILFSKSWENNNEIN